MGYSFLEFIKRIGIFIICAQSIMHFAAGQSYEKYVKLLIGIMLLAQFVVPLRAIFIGADSAEIWSKVEAFEQEMSLAAEENRLVFEEPEAADYVQAEIVEKLGGVADRYGCEIRDVSLVEVPPELVITLAAKAGTDGGIKIDKIKLEDTPAKESQFPSPMEAGREEEMKREFCVSLGTDEEYLKIAFVK